MNARAINAAAGVIHAAMQTRQTAAGIAVAVDAAGMLMSPETAAAHAAEVDRWKTTAASWRTRAYAAENVRWDDEVPPGGEVCATCEQPVESEPCREHNPRALVEQLRADRNAFADRVDTLTAVAKGNKQAYVEAVATVAALEQKRVELERIANTERERVAELERQLAAARADGAGIVRSLLPTQPDNETDEAIAWALKLAADAVERGHR